MTRPQDPARSFRRFHQQIHIREGQLLLKPISKLTLPGLIWETFLIRCWLSRVVLWGRPPTVDFEVLSLRPHLQVKLTLSHLQQFRLAEKKLTGRRSVFKKNLSSNGGGTSNTQHDVIMSV